MKRTSFIGLLLMASLLISGCGGDKKAGEPGKTEYKAQMKLATLTPASATTSTGSATFMYRDNGCGADRTDTLQERALYAPEETINRARRLARAPRLP